MSDGFEPMPPVPAPFARRVGFLERLGARPYLVALIAVGLWIGLWVAFLVVYANQDHLGYLNSVPVRNRVAEACRTLSADLAGQTSPAAASTTDPTTAAEAIRSENRTVGVMTRSVEALGQDTLAGDDPALPWLADWDTVVQLREEYAANLLAGKPARLVLPTKDGIPISWRMGDVAPECALAVRVLLDLPGR